MTRRYAIVGMLALVVVGCSDWATTTEAGSGIARPWIHVLGDASQRPPRYVELSEFEALPRETWTIYDPFSDGVIEFTGVRLDALVSAWGTPKTKRVSFDSLDGYRISFFEREWKTLDVMVATHQDGQVLGRDDKGPARIVVRTEDDALERALISKWVWKIQQIELSTSPAPTPGD